MQAAARIVLLLLTTAVCHAQVAPVRPAGATAAPAADPKAAAESMRAVYRKTAEAAAEETRSGVEAAEQKFLAEMDRLKEAFDLSGDLEKNLALAEERGSFELSRVPPAGPALKAVPELAPLIEALDKNRIEARRNGHTSHMRVAVPYVKRLAELEGMASRKGDIDLAAALRGERTEIEAQIRAAQEFLAAHPGSGGETDRTKVTGPGGNGGPPTAPGKVMLPAFTRMLKPLEDKIRFYQSFDTDWATTGMVDLSGNAIPCATTNAVFNAKGKRGAMVELGPRSQIIVPAHAALQGHDSLSVSLWFRTRDAYGNLLVAEFDADEEEHSSFAIVLRGDGQIQLTSGESRASSNRDKLDNNQWHHVVAVKTPEELTLYLDGEFAGKAPNKTPTKKLPRLVVGYETRRYDSYSGEYRPHRFSGNLDELVIFNAALGAQDAKTIFQSQK